VPVARRVTAIVAGAGCALALLACAGSSATTPACSGAAGVRVAPPERGLYHAAFPFFVRGDRNEDYVDSGRLAGFERLAGKRIAWAYFSQHWFRGIRFPQAEARTIWRHGSVPFIRLMPWSAQGEHRAEPTFTLQRILDGAFDGQLAVWARDAGASGIPLMVEFGTEVNGRWFPWNGVWNGGGRRNGYGDPAQADGPERFRDAYRHIVTLFRANGTSNVTWVFHVNHNSDPVAPWNRIAAYYPGDGYVDWVGVSVYAAQTPGESWTEFQPALAAAYGELARIAPTKPIAVLEYGAPEARDPRRKAGWIAAALRTLRSGRFPRVKAAAWWDERWTAEKGRAVDMSIGSSPAARAAYRRGVAGTAFQTRARLRCGP
jgi:hypothetical protein